jgi:hypothetical protein
MCGPNVRGGSAWKDPDRRGSHDERACMVPGEIDSE